MENKLLLAGVIGDPISHSKSPTLHRFWLNQNNINGHYIPLKVSKIDLELVLKTLPKMGFSGVNVTVPHKESVLKIANEITLSASQIGSANTLTFLPCGGFKADNTDGYGFLKNLEENEAAWDPLNAKVLIIGMGGLGSPVAAGGASRAVISALLKSGVSKIVITNRTHERANELKEYFDRKIDVIKWNEKEQFLGEINTLVNTTTLGMLGCENLDLSLSSINMGTIVLDLVYNPIKTTLLQNAKKQGCKIIDGLGMLLHQATPGFKEWFGVIDNKITKANNQLLAPGTLYRKSLHDLIGEPDLKTFKGAADFEYWSRILFNGYKGIYSPEAYWLYRVSEMSVSHSTDFPSIINTVGIKYNKLWSKKY